MSKSNFPKGYHQNPNFGRTCRHTRMSRGTLVGVIVGTLFLVGAIGTGVALQGCTTTGVVARNEALLPNLKQAWKPVQTCIALGIQDSVDTGDMTAEDANVVIEHTNKISDAFNLNSTPATIKVALTGWQALKPYADLGVAAKVHDRTISLGVSLSLMEQINLFDQAVRLYLER